MIKVAHLITGLGTGGAETSLFRLLARMDRAEFGSRVISLLPGGPVADRIRGLGVGVDDLGMRRSVPGPLGFARLVRLLRRERPDILQTWMHHANLMGLLAAPLAGISRVVWNIRCSNMDFSRYSPLTRLTVRLCSRLSARPLAVVTNSRRAKGLHLEMNYRPRRFEVIPNGIETGIFRPDPEAGPRLRAGLGIEADSPLVGLVARYDPMKGHEVFLRAASLILDQAPKTKFLLCGDGADENNPALARLIKDLGLGSTVLLLGRRDDPEKFMAGLDLACSSSLFGEGFPNVLAEAMACGIPCVATDVGDAAHILGRTGEVVPPNNAESLSQGILRLLRLDPGARAGLGREARKRVEENFGMERNAAAYAALYRDLMREDG